MSTLHSHTSSSVYDRVVWTRRDIEIPGAMGTRSVSIEAPADWSDQSVAVVTSVYLMGTQESSIRNMIQRVVNTVTDWTIQVGHVKESELEQFSDRLAKLFIFQRASLNSPSWMNLGVPGRRQQASACYLLKVEDSLDSILNWYREEGLIFQGGAGAGINLSPLRSSSETLAGGGTSSGPVSFMRGADASAGTIKSGGSTRRAAKMVVLDVDHPDIQDFIWCKATEERKARALRSAGFDVGVGGKDSFSLQYQNANNSVRIPDSFMNAVVEGKDWHLRSRKSGEIIQTLPAKELFKQIAQAAWECGDPGMQFHDRINQGNTSPNSGGEIVTTNPCGETHLGPNQSCNLASLNLPKYLNDDGSFDIETFVVDAQLLITVMDAIAVKSDYPTEDVARNARRHRPLGLGVTGLGELLMRLAIPYDSDEARDISGAIVHLLTSASWARSADLAAKTGAFDGWEEDRGFALEVLESHNQSCMRGQKTAGQKTAGQRTKAIWRRACEMAASATREAKKTGLRNTQVTAIAPTGTISWMMGAATTGIEPAFSLVTTKKLISGQTVRVPLPCLAAGLTALGYDTQSVQNYTAAIEEGGDLSGMIYPEHLSVFATAVGPQAINPMAHVAMLAAVQSGVSQGVSKTVNLPTTATVEDVENVFMEAWRRGCKAVAVYRDGSKAAQPLSSKKSEVDVAPPTQLARRKMLSERRAQVYTVHVGSMPVYVHMGLYPDGEPGELFLRVAKAGSTLSGLLDVLAVTASLGLQYGVPIEDLLRHWRSTHFEPSGPTGDATMPWATSLVDAVAKRLSLALGLEQPFGSSGELVDVIVPSAPPTVDGAAPVCSCGSLMVRTGTCWSCPVCGESGGCG